MRGRWARFMRFAASRGDALIHERMYEETDYRGILRSIHVPTAILQQEDEGLPAAEWMVTQIEVECEGRHAFTPVLMGPAASPPLLGATTLEELGLGVDPLGRRLVPVDLYLA